eukprot:4967022-Amphidinium_carterae.2
MGIKCQGLRYYCIWSCAFRVGSIKSVSLVLFSWYPVPSKNEHVAIKGTGFYKDPPTRVGSKHFTNHEAKAPL